MHTPPSLYCNECGAALLTQATYCPVCQHRVGAPSPDIPPDPPPRVLLPLAPHVQEHKPLQRGEIVQQRYMILEQIGEGGFGLVYKARDRWQRNKLVAVKQINLSTLSPKEMIEVTDSYNREVFYLSKLSHENIPQLYDHFTDSAHWYIVMDLIEGETLETSLHKKRRKFLPVKQVVEAGMALSHVLEYLHTQKPPIVFRDVKPGNIMRTRKGKYYLIDFGIARTYDYGKRRDTVPLGSPDYAAPEQYGLAQTDARTDIYGLGVTLQTLLAGKERGELAQDKRAQRRLKRLPQRLQKLLAQMLHSDAAQRPGDMLEVRYRLEQYRADSLLQRGGHYGTFLFHLLFNKYIFLWIIDLPFMIWLARSFFFLPYLVLALILPASFLLHEFAAELEGNPKPLDRAEIESTIREAFGKSTIPMFGLTFSCWIYMTVTSGDLGTSLSMLPYFICFPIGIIALLIFFLRSLIKLYKNLPPWYKQKFMRKKQRAKIHTPQQPPLQQTM